MPDQNPTDPQNTTAIPATDTPPMATPPEPVNMPAMDGSEVTPPPPIVVQEEPEEAGSAAPPSNLPEEMPKKKFGRGRLVATILGVLILVGGLGAGLVLVQQQQIFKQRASMAEPCKECNTSTHKCETIATPPNCTASLNTCSTDASCGGTPTPTATRTPTPTLTSTPTPTFTPVPTPPCSGFSTTTCPSSYCQVSGGKCVVKGTPTPTATPYCNVAYVRDVGCGKNNCPSTQLAQIWKAVNCTEVTRCVDSATCTQKCCCGGAPRSPSTCHWQTSCTGTLYPSEGSASDCNGAPPICASGEKKCVGTELQTCSADRTVWISQHCTNGCNSTTKACNPAPTTTASPTPGAYCSTPTEGCVCSGSAASIANGTGCKWHKASGIWFCDCGGDLTCDGPSGGGGDPCKDASGNSVNCDTLGRLRCNCGNGNWMGIADATPNNPSDNTAQCNAACATLQCPSCETPIPPDVTTCRCLAIRAWDTNWNEIKADQLSALKAGDRVRFTVSSTFNKGNVDKAIFKINGQETSEITALKPGETSMYYYEYVIPEGVTSFTVNAKIHHTTLGWSN